MQFGFMPGKGTVDAIFIVRRMQEEYQRKDKKLYTVIPRYIALHLLLLCIIFYSAFFTVNPDWLRGFTVV